ncbi:putative eukaryotic membrane protein family [Rosellinia necatrix]|uniref:Putative eukaryotic membrane protein family n=1 Tax=Rosellinia necatrix TaxID=77044 RepID=A0A1W2TX90_ROSNE|nr:putative eukaryotic membrane protein family [Rosellinia necatrix]
MPGRVSGDSEIHGGGMDAGDGRNGRAAKKRHNNAEHGTGTRRLATQCPTPPTDPFPDLESIPTAPGASHLGEGTLAETRADKDMPDRPPLSVESLGPSADLPLSRTDNTNTARSPLLEEYVGGASKPRTLSRTRNASHESVRKLSASQMQALMSASGSLPVAVIPPPSQRKPCGAEYPLSAGVVEDMAHHSMADQLQDGIEMSVRARNESVRSNGSLEARTHVRPTADDFQRPPPSGRTLSSPPINRRPPPSGSAPTTAPLHSRRNSFNPLPVPAPLNLNAPALKSTQVAPKLTPTRPAERHEPSPPASPILPTIPLPPMSLPTHLQLELAGQRPSPLYIHHSQPADTPYESSAVKFERLLNALLLPPYLEQIMYFGTLACFDAWLYTFTILPMRFLSAVGVLVKWWLYLIWKEVRWVVGFVWSGIGRLWRRGRRGRKPSRDQDDSSRAPSDAERSQSRARGSSSQPQQNGGARQRNVSDTHRTSFREQSQSGVNGAMRPPKHAMPRPGHFRHRRTKSMPSNLTSYHKADLLQGALLICSFVALSGLDASRMYHFIRAQSSMKLYVIYNILEVGDRLLSAIGQDILECLFSSETLSRNSSGRSKILLPFGMFILSLIYNVIHTWCLFYQVITLNVAVNSYSNSLLPLLISNQFVEIKGSVFKKVEKENLFQLTCSDVVERFQTCIILLIIGMRNVVEVGGLSVVGTGSELDGGSLKTGPLHTTSILPASFKVLPTWLQSGEVLSPFIVVIGVEMLVDWIKHAYINKFNNVKPTIYRRMLDILCKDYYTNAFSAPSLTRRLGLPLLPLSCLFIRASFQVYHMFLATHIPSPIPTTTTDLSAESSTPSSAAMIAAFEQLDTLIRHALGRAVYPHESSQDQPWWSFSSDDMIALLAMVVFFFLTWIVLLIVKLLLGMLLLRYSHRRYAIMKLKEHAVARGKAEQENFSQPGQRIGAWGGVEIGDDRRKWIYEDDPEGLKRMRDRDRKTQEKFKEAGDDGLAKVVRYEMVAKRIW